MISMSSICHEFIPQQMICSYVVSSHGYFFKFSAEILGVFCYLKVNGWCHDDTKSLLEKSNKLSLVDIVLGYGFLANISKDYMKVIQHEGCSNPPLIRRLADQ